MIITKIMFICVYFYNSLPTNLQELTNTDTFKKQLKTHLWMTIIYFVDAPLVTSGVSGIVK